MKDSYEEFLSGKQVCTGDHGIKVKPSKLSSSLFDWQKDIVTWALRKGRAALFTDTGTGKTRMQLEWARHIQKHTKGMVLILAPLAVAEQTVREGEKISVPVQIVATQEQCKKPGIYITNYEKLEHFHPDEFHAIVLDESSIIKHQDSKTRGKLLEAFAETKYKLACTASPAPNDYMELGNHAEFIGVLTMSEMLATYFVHDGKETQKWRLKGHAEESFWKWMAGWAICCRKPSELGYSDEGFALPELVVHKHIVRSLEAQPQEGYLMAIPAATLKERLTARRESLNERVEHACKLVKADPDAWLVWCKLNHESEMMTEGIGDRAQEVTGSHMASVKASKMIDFATGEINTLVSKPEICGFGMNFQVCHNVLFVGLDDSYERYYQAIRRCWRYGQKHPVHVHLVISDMEGAVLRNIERKANDAENMMASMVKGMAEITRAELDGTKKQKIKYMTDKQSGKNFTLHNADCVEVWRDIPDNSIGYTLYSPPFRSLYTYSASERDMGNCTDEKEFAEHFKFLIPHLLRTTAPGRLMSFHCMNLPTSKSRDGFIGISDFRGELIRVMVEAGWIYHSEVVIWKDPVTAMQRTKALGLLHKQIEKDSCMSRQGIPDFLVTMRKPGENKEPVEGQFDRFVGEDGPMREDNNAAGRKQYSINVWQRYASPVWIDINQSRTLQKTSAREDRDERHICPLQLDVIERALELWTNEGDLVASPFTGIGSEGYMAIKMGRKFIGAELKKSYYEQALANLRNVEEEMETDLFRNVTPEPKKEKAEPCLL